MLPAWVLGLGLAVLVTATSYADLYATEASRREVVATLGATPATLALYGRIYADSVEGLVGWRLGGIALALAGLMTILLVTRHTRAEEETGRAELVGAGAVGRYAPLAAALLVAALASRRARRGRRAGRRRRRARHDRCARPRRRRSPPPASPSRASPPSPRSSRSPRAPPTGSRSPCSAQRSRSARSATPGPHWLSWLSPIGWGQQVRALADNRWPVLLLLLAAAAALLAAAIALYARRDLGAGVFPPRPGPARGALAHAPRNSPGACSAARCSAGPRASRSSVRAFGSIAQDIGDVIGDSAGRARGAAQARRAGEPRRRLPRRDAADPRLIAAAYAIQATLRLRAEETSGRAEPLLATATSRTRWALSHAAIAFAGTAALLAAAGLAAGLGHAAQTGDAAQIPRVLAAALAQTPAAWVLAGLTLALFGALPKGTAAAWGALALALALGQLGPVADLPQTLIDVSPFAHSPQLPCRQGRPQGDHMPCAGGSLDAGPLVLTALATALAAAGLAALRGRDLQA